MKLLKCMEVEVLQFEYTSYDEYTEHHEQMMKRGFTYQDDRKGLDADSITATYIKKL
ncbi:hypothetical protein_gp242 [Bacillus phage vB_BceM_WH1]|nr:hypothetical protein_gp242 [Bacillus phage vB_BceM_WH1]